MGNNDRLFSRDRCKLYAVVHHSHIHLAASCSDNHNRTQAQSNKQDGQDQEGFVSSNPGADATGAFVAVQGSYLRRRMFLRAARSLPALGSGYFGNGNAGAPGHGDYSDFVPKTMPKRPMEN